MKQNVSRYRVTWYTYFLAIVFSTEKVKLKLFKDARYDCAKSNDRVDMTLFQLRESHMPKTGEFMACEKLNYLYYTIYVARLFIVSILK